jgi:hypothetical protein
MKGRLTPVGLADPRGPDDLSDAIALANPGRGEPQAGVRGFVQGFALEPNDLRGECERHPDVQFGQEQLAGGELRPVSVSPVMPAGGRT